ncbi:GspMb/PilO family protein [Phenylobacterium sp.]|jgi:hypothetical protein|uniref:GspMb/PilO family protein n=1 Tax=Phenylobacterium sp. TaxID=1871053 RepID=UPI002E365533|nr:GspMb/PilO family protein [Phenylobacterium sp.]
MDLALAAGVAMAGALAMALLLTQLGAPAKLSARLEALTVKTDQARDLMRAPPSDRLYAADALCRHDPGAAAQALREGLAASAAQANLSVDFLEAHPDGPGDSPGGLAPMRLKFSVTGSYENVVGLLATLARQRPAIFADGVDLTAKTANVTASFSGRAFCAA